MTDTTTHTGWRLSESIASELDLALSLALSRSFRGLIPELATALERLPDDWYAQGQDLLEGIAGDFFTLFSRWAALAGVTCSGDFSGVTMRLREMGRDDLVEVVGAAAASVGCARADGGDPCAGLIDLTLAMRDRAGLRFAPGTDGSTRLRRECRLLVDVTRDGPRHTHFWHWVDRFYYEIYQPWRLTRLAFMDAERVRATAQLGAREGATPPRLDWLPRQNHLVGSSVVGRQVADGSARVVFWIEPFGTWDVLDVLPEGYLTSFGEPGEVQEMFRQRATEIAGGLKALADPTRLTMLRIVRQLEIDNSEIAHYMELSHPTVSVHAKVLRQAQLLHSRREGRRIFHSLDPDALRDLLRTIEGFLGVSDD